MKRLLLHIGTGKTGTSSIQNFLFANHALLAKNFSVLYPKYGLSKTAHFGEIIHAHYPIVSWVIQRDTEQLQKLVNTLKNSVCETAIISCEDFYHHLGGQEIDFFASFFKDFRVEIICYVRRQDFYMESAWKQQVKVGALKTPFPVFLQRHTQAKFLNEVHGNYYRMLKPWAAAFGMDNIRLKVFDKSEWVNADLIEDFFATCGFDLSQNRPNFVKPRFSNIAFPTDLVRLLQKTNAKELIPKAQQQNFVDYLSKLKTFDNNPLLSTADRLAIITNYQSTNQALFTEFCHRPIPECFQAVAIENTEKKDSTSQVLLEDIAIKAIVAAWKQSRFLLPVNKKSVIKTIRRVYKSYLKIPLKNIFRTHRYESSDRTVDFSKVSKSSPFVLDLKSSEALESKEKFFYYGFPLPSSKTAILSSLPRCSITVNNCFISTSSATSDNAKLLFGALYENGQLIKAASYRGPAAVASADPATISQDRINKAQLVPGSCVYMGWLFFNFGHLLLEAPARFWFLNSIDVRKSFFIFHPFRDCSLKNIFQLELAQALFSSFGINKEQIILADQDLYVEHLTIPSSLFFINLTIDSSQLAVYKQLKSSILQNSPHPPLAKKRVYLSRRSLTQSNARKALNEKAIEQLFEHCGFEVVFPEQLSLQAQVQLLSETKIIAGCDGSALHMAVFLPPLSKMIVLSTRGVPVNQMLMSGLGNIETHFINAGKDRSVILPTKGAWEADIDFIKEQLDKIMKNIAFEKLNKPIEINSGNKTLNTELCLTNIDNLVTQASVIPAGQHFACHTFLPASTQTIEPSIWLGNGGREIYQRQTAEIPAANFYEFHNVFLAGQGLIVDNEGQLFSSKHISSLGHPITRTGINPTLIHVNENDPHRITFKNKLAVRIIEEPCIPLSQGGEIIYGHWLVDILPRVLFAQQMKIKGKYLLTTRLPDYGRKLLNLLGVADEEIVTYNPETEAILMKICYFPGYLRHKSAFSPLVAQLTEKFSPYRANCIGRKLFVSRGDYNQLQVISNQHKLHALLSNYGLEIVEPHKYSIEEQIRLFSQASLVIGEHGSAMHNTLFSNANTKVIMLQSDKTRSFIQAGLGAVLQQPTGFVFGQQEKENNPKGRSFEAPLDLVKSVIEEMMG